MSLSWRVNPLSLDSNTLIITNNQGSYDVLARYHHDLIQSHKNLMKGDFLVATMYLETDTNTYVYCITVRENNKLVGEYKGEILPDFSAVVRCYYREAL